MTGFEPAQRGQIYVTLPGALAIRPPARDNITCVVDWVHTVVVDGTVVEVGVVVVVPVLSVAEVTNIPSSITFIGSEDLLLKPCWIFVPSGIGPIG